MDYEEAVMDKRGMTGVSAAICLILVVILGYGCGGGGPIASRDQHVQQQVGNEYFLQQAGFKKYQVNQNMPQQEALISALPKRTVTLYERDGQKLYAYGDKDSRILYIGDEAAYQRYLALSKGREICAVRAGGGESANFWGCMDQYRQGGGGQPGK
jgi:hypothetical protein